MSTRDELRSDLSVVKGLRGAKLDDLTDWMHSKGWRMIPSAEEVEAVVQRHWEAWTGRESQDFSTIVATSILALMDGGQ